MHGGVGIGDGDHQFQLFGDACGATLNASGTGSFTFADGLTSVGLADLSTFALSVDFSNSTNGDPEGTFTYGLGNLRDFSASVGPGPSLTALAFDTAWVQPSTGHLADQLFEVTSLGAGGASTRLPISSTSSIPFTIGAITITSIETSPLPSAVPEPASLAMLASGLPIALVAWRRRRAARAAWPVHGRAGTTSSGEADVPEVAGNPGPRIGPETLSTPLGRAHGWHLGPGLF